MVSLGHQGQRCAPTNAKNSSGKGISRSISQTASLPKILPDSYLGQVIGDGEQGGYLVQDSFFPTAEVLLAILWSERSTASSLPKLLLPGLGRVRVESHDHELRLLYLVRRSPASDLRWSRSLEHHVLLEDDQCW
jgi:hypothetical protein